MPSTWTIRTCAEGSDRFLERLCGLFEFEQQTTLALSILTQATQDFALPLAFDLELCDQPRQSCATVFAITNRLTRLALQLFEAIAFFSKARNELRIMPHEDSQHIRAGEHVGKRSRRKNDTDRSNLAAAIERDRTCGQSPLSSRMFFLRDCDFRFDLFEPATRGSDIPSRRVAIMRNSLQSSIDFLELFQNGPRICFVLCDAPPAVVNRVTQTLEFLCPILRHRECWQTQEHQQDERQTVSRYFESSQCPPTRPHPVRPSRR